MSLAEITVFTSIGDYVLNAAALAAIQGANPTPVTVTVAGATPAQTHGADTELVVSAASVAVVGNGNLAANRGALTMQGATAGYFYGSEGKVTASGTVAIGSGYLVGALGQINLSGATITNGHVAGVIANIQNPVASSYVDGVYVESSGPAQINSMLKGIANSQFIFDVSVDSGSPVAYATTSASVTNVGTKGWLAVNVGGVTRYIPLGDGVT
jgi:hypothetical protein